MHAEVFFMKQCSSRMGFTKKTNKKKTLKKCVTLSTNKAESGADAYSSKLPYVTHYELQLLCMNYNRDGYRS